MSCSSKCVDVVLVVEVEVVVVREVVVVLEVVVLIVEFVVVEGIEALETFADVTIATIVIIRTTETPIKVKR